MVRKLSLAIAVALGVSSFGVNALGLGALHSKSALNEYFKADIELLSLDQEELDDVKVKLAPAEAFRNAGIERPFYLSQLRFKPMHLPDGRGVIRVTSRDPVREPFLDFLVEVNWPKGRLLREYTVLLDPPVTLARRPAPVSKPRAAVQRPAPRETLARQDTRATSPAPSATTYTEDGEYGPTRQNDTLWGIASRVRHRGVTQEQMMMSLFQANPDAFIGSNINKLKVGEILRLPTREESQAMTAAEARQAFRNQLNEWRAASPAREEVAAASVEVPAAPAAEVPAPEAELKIATPRPEGEGEAGPGESKDPAAVVELLREELLASEEAKQSALEEGKELQSRVKDLEAQLSDLQRLVTLQNNQLAQLQVALGDVEAEQAPLEQATEAAVGDGESLQQPAPEQEEVAAEAQVTETEAVVTEEVGTAAVEVDTTVTEEVTLIDEATPGVEESTEEPGEKTAADESTSDTPTAEETAAAATAGTAADSEAIVADQEEIVLDAGDAEEPVIEVDGDVLADVDSASATAEPEQAPVAETDNAIDEPMPAPVDETITEVQPEPAAEVTPPVADEAPMPVKATKQTLLEKLAADPNLMMGAAAGGGVILLAIIWAALSRRRRARNDEFEESILVNTIEEGGDEVSLGAEGPTSHPTEETSFLSDFSPSDIDALQEETGEVDPVAEADVYIAYGRYKQAEELIRQALEKDPEHTDLKLKLAEVLYATKDEEAFLELAEQAAESGMANENPEGWEKLVSMGSKIAPSSQLFATGAAAAIASGMQASETQDSTAAKAAVDELDLGELASDLDAGDEAFAGLDDLDNLNLGDLGDLSDIAAIDDEEKGADALDNGLDFDLDLGSSQEVDTQEMATAGKEEEEPVFDLGALEDTGTLSLDDLTSELVDTEDEAPLELPEELNEDTLSQMAEELEETVIDFSGNEQAAVAEQGLDELDLGDEQVPAELTAEFDVTTDTSAEVSSLEQPEPGEPELPADDVIPQGDEVNTKLDLARAYVDMGDSEGARDILDEVVEEGSETQQDEARKLMQALG